MKLIFGGSWHRHSRPARVASRLGTTTDNCLIHLGLRLARTPVQRMNQ